MFDMRRRQFITLVGGMVACCSFSGMFAEDGQAVPNYKELIYSVVKSSFVDPLSVGTVEISPLHPTRGPQLGNWMACLRITINGQPTLYAAFIDKEPPEVSLLRRAVRFADCGQDQYEPFSGPPPPENTPKKSPPRKRAPRKIALATDCGPSQSGIGVAHRVHHRSDSGTAHRQLRRLCFGRTADARELGNNSGRRPPCRFWDPAGRRLHVRARRLRWHLPHGCPVWRAKLAIIVCRSASGAAGRPTAWLG